MSPAVRIESGGALVRVAKGAGGMRRVECGDVVELAQGDADRLVARGSATLVAAPESDAGGLPDSLDGLKKYAADNDIKLPSAARTKAQIKAAIAAASTVAVEDPPTGGDGPVVGDGTGPTADADGASDDAPPVTEGGDGNE